MAHYPKINVEPSPYELYIRLEALQELWPAASAPLAKVVTACGFQAIELTFRLIEETLRDSRAEAFAEKKLRRFVGHVRDSLSVISGHLVGQDCPYPTYDAQSAFSPGLSVARSLPVDLMQEVVSAYEAAETRVSFRFGVTGQLRQLRDMAPPDGRFADRKASASHKVLD